MTSEQRRKLGAFYTPELVTNTLCSWAITKLTDIVLEPSFGGCNFLTSSLAIFKNLGNTTPEENIFGFDIDPSAFKQLSDKGIVGKNFRLEDFLYSEIETNDIRVDVIIGNPPYLPIHKLNLLYKENLYKKYKKAIFKIPRRSSLWVYFIVHSFQYLNKGGRMAWVVPDSIAFTDYGKSLTKQLAAVFTKVQLYRTDERFFYDAGTHEKTALLLCEGYQSGNSKLEIFEFLTLQETLKAVNSKKKKNSYTKTHKSDFDNKNFQVFSLGEVFTTRIGIVIGATKLLAFKKEDAIKSEYYPEYFYPIITKGKQLKNLIIDRKLLLQNEDLPVYLLDVIKLEKDDPVRFRQFLNEFPSDILINQTFSTRSQLFGYDDYKHPDAFLTYFSQGLPKLIVNHSLQLNCTNSVHRLYLKEDFRNKPWIMKFIAIQTFVDFMENETILLARQYGNKIKKFEPSDAQKIPVILPAFENQLFIKELDKVFTGIVDLVQLDKITEAKELAKQYLWEQFDISAIIQEESILV